MRNGDQTRTSINKKKNTHIKEKKNNWVPNEIKTKQIHTHTCVHTHHAITHTSTYTHTHVITYTQHTCSYKKLTSIKTYTPKKKFIQICDVFT
jgi:hypothetical protein